MHESTLITPQGVISQRLLFNIPIYQRLYVWGSDQIKVLLDDLVAACEADKDVFYLGGTLVIEQTRSPGEPPLFDLIDGQQRFTTLWLLSIAMERMASQLDNGEINCLTEFRSVTLAGRAEPRIRFAIRPEVSRFFDALLKGANVPDVAAASSLSRAITEIEGYFNDHRTLSLRKLSAFILEKVQLVLTRVPPQTDLNKLFEVINNRGLQLQHHDILKTRLLACLDEGRQRDVFGQLWDACAHMNDYVEKNLRTAAGIKLVPLYALGDASADNEALADPISVREALEHIYKGGNQQVLSLSEILNGEVDSGQGDGQVGVDEDYEADVVRSIITFPMLLQHVLRIFLKDRGADIDRILDKDLLQIFETHWLATRAQRAERASEVMRFIDLLWRCRYLFDKYVIKWVEESDEEIHAIRQLRLNSSRGYRSLIRESGDADTAFAMLQSMLYHSQQLTTHYWLTPLLNYLLEHGGKDAHSYLKYLDNYLLCSTSEEPLIKRTRRFLDHPWCTEFRLIDIKACLGKEEGTSFSHYWFYKLEYILWERYRGQKNRAAWQAFRMTAKNSVEHVSPQNPEECDSNRVSKQVLDTFGNLALVSRGVNSEYGNKPYVEKQARFGARNAQRVDSLKLALIYENKHWNDDLAKSHRAQMIAEYQTYFESVETASKKLNPQELST